MFCEGKGLTWRDDYILVFGMKDRQIFWFLVALWSVCGSSVGWGNGLSFGQSEHVFSAVPGQEAETAVFSFENKSGRTIRIESVSASCGCTAPELKKREYAAGEGGQIKAVFTFGSRVGEQRKNVVVKTDEPATYQLMIRGEIPEVVRMTPRMVRWTIGEEVSAKSIEITVHETADLKFVGIDKDSESFVVETLEGPVERQQTIRIIPVSTEQRARASLNARFVDGAGKTVVHRLYAFVR